MFWNKGFLASFFFVTLGATGFTESLAVNCVQIKRVCFTSEDCSWAYGRDFSQSVNLKKIGEGSDYTAWEGKISGLIWDEYLYTLSVYRVRGNTTYNLLTADVDDNAVRSVGEELTEVTYLNQDFGIGIRCWTGLL